MPDRSDDDGDGSHRPPASTPRGSDAADAESEEATILHHPTAPEIAEFDDVIDLTDRRRILLQMVFGVDVDDPDSVFEREF